MRVLMIEDERDTAEALSWGPDGGGLRRRPGGQRRRRAVEGDRERPPAVSDGQLFSRRVTA